MYNAAMLAGSRLRRPLLLAGCLTAAIFLAVAVWGLRHGHPHEDAYILFAYVDHVADGKGIVFSEGAERAEGATDFLWMMLLAALRVAGVPAGIGAAVLNAAGLGVVAAVCVRALRWTCDARSQAVAAPVVSACVAVSPMAAAALGGFSAGFYSGVVAVLLHLTVFGTRRRAVLVPWCALLLALVRPDGAIVGACFAAIALVRALRAGDTRRMLGHAVLAAAAGAAYFVWRWQYFGLPLPLPLYVKSKSDTGWPGLAPNLEWARSVRALGVLAAVAVLAQRPVRGLRLALAFAPPALLVVVLATAHQSQNVAFRFQAPATTAAYVGAFAALGWVLRRRTAAARATAFALLLPGLLFAGPAGFSAALADLRGTAYINYFPALLRPSTTDATVIALSEAGRMGYWLPGRKLDLVGLNSPDVAVRGLSPETLAAADPDVIFVHLDGTLDVPAERTDDVLRLSAADLRGRVLDRRGWADVGDPVRRAPVVACAHLLAHPDDYEILLVWYTDAYAHLHAVKRSGRVPVEAYAAALRESFRPERRRSYLEMHGTVTPDRR